MSGLRLLIVDGDGNMLDKLQRFLWGRGHKVEVASDATSAVEWVRQREFDLVMLEAELPGGGIEGLSSALGRLRPRPEFVLMTSPDTDAALVSRLGANRVLGKPFSGRQLLELLKETRPLPKGSAPSPQNGRAAPEGRSAQAAGVPMAVGGGVRLNGASSGRGASNNPLSDVMRRLEAVAPLRTIMSRVGRLEKTPFPALLYKLFANRSSGVLTIQRAGSERVVFFLNGEPVYGLSDAASDSFGAVLVNLGYIKIRELNAVLKSRQEGQSLGAALLNQNLVSSDQLLHAMERQVYDRVLSCFSFVSGRYVFSEDTDWLGEVRLFRQNPIQLICDGVHRFVGPNVLATQLQPHLHQFVVRTEKFDAFLAHFPQAEAHQEALSLIIGDKTLQQITLQVNGDLMGVLRLVSSLYLADMIDFLDEPRTTAERSSHKPPLPSRPPTDHEQSRQRLMREETARRERAQEAQREQADEHARIRDALSEWVLNMYVRLGHVDHWQLLGVESDADASALEAAYERALAQMPAEHLALLSDTVREKALEVHEVLKRAHQTLVEPGARRHYLKRLEQRRKQEERRLEGHVSSPSLPSPRSLRQDRGASPHNADESSSSMAMGGESLGVESPELEARRSLSLIELQSAREAAEESDWRVAYKHIKRANQLNPDSSEIVVFLAWVIFNLPHRDRERQIRVCRNRIEVELGVNSAMPEAHYYLGRIAEELQDAEKALDHFQAALLIEPNYEAAVEALGRIWTSPALAVLPAPPNDEDADLIDRLRTPRRP